MSTIPMYQVPKQVLEGIVQYMRTKPFNEVEQLLVAVNATARLVEVPLEPPAPPIEVSKTA